MSRLLITSDLHLGHNNIHKFRPQFDTAEDHHNEIFESLAINLKKNDSIIFLGDICFNDYWLGKIKELNCKKKTLILGNHDTEKVSIRDIAFSYDAVHSMMNKRNSIFTHCPIHRDEFRQQSLNIHGHLHGRIVGNRISVLSFGQLIEAEEDDNKYFNACVEHTDYKPITYAEIMERTQ
tara:strand:- start:44 stop:580 length:537 start_codon:yes stop_codon:yes gene_type:complete